MGGEVVVGGVQSSTRPPTALITDVCVSQLTAHRWSAGPPQARTMLEQEVKGGRRALPRSHEEERKRGCAH